MNEFQSWWQTILCINKGLNGAVQKFDTSFFL